MRNTPRPNMALSNFHLTGRKILGAGLNYRALLPKNAPKPEAPLIFEKATSSYITEGKCIEIPSDFVVNEEVELGVVIGKKGKNITEARAMDFIGGYCLALDMTETKFLSEARAKGLPWIFVKSFDTACPVSRLVTCDELADPSNVRLWCKVNGHIVQDANTDDLLFPVGELISHISKYMTLEPGDLILTGCPPGSTRVIAGDIIEAGLGDILTMQFPVKAV